MKKTKDIVVALIIGFAGIGLAVFLFTGGFTGSDIIKQILSVIPLIVGLRAFYGVFLVLKEKDSKTSSKRK